MNLLLKKKSNNYKKLLNEIKKINKDKAIKGKKYNFNLDSFDEKGEKK